MRLWNCACVSSKGQTDPRSSNQRPYEAARADWCFGWPLLPDYSRFRRAPPQVSTGRLGWHQISIVVICSAGNDTEIIFHTRPMSPWPSTSTHTPSGRAFASLLRDIQRSFLSSLCSCHLSSLHAELSEYVGTSGGGEYRAIRVLSLQL